MENKYTAAYFINKFQNTSLESWGVGFYRSVRANGKEVSCALGQCGVNSHIDAMGNEEARALVALFGGHKGEDYNTGVVTRLNDYVDPTNTHSRYNTPTQAKEAILCKLTEVLFKQEEDGI